MVPSGNCSATAAVRVPPHPALSTARSPFAAGVRQCVPPAGRSSCACAEPRGHERSRRRPGLWVLGPPASAMEPGGGDGRAVPGVGHVRVDGGGRAHESRGEAEAWVRVLDSLGVGCLVRLTTGKGACHCDPGAQWPLLSRLGTAVSSRGPWRGGQGAGRRGPAGPRGDLGGLSRAVARAVGDLCRLLKTSRGVSTQLPCQWPGKGAPAGVPARQSCAVALHSETWLDFSQQ